MFPVNAVTDTSCMMLTEGWALNAPILMEEYYLISFIL